MLSPDDIKGFYADPTEIDLEQYVQLEYVFETREDPKLIAASLCAEQSTAQWKRPGRNEDYRSQYGAKVLSLQKKGENRYRVEVAHPHRNFGPRIPNFLSAAAGEGPFYCSGIDQIKWTNFSFPINFLHAFEGPKYGPDGIRVLAGVYDRPLFVGVVKPNIGLAPSDFASIAYESWVGGLDIAKDDEMLSDFDGSTRTERIRLVEKARQKAEQETGQKKLFVANITDEVDRIASLCEQVTEGGANMVMINSIMMGISSLRLLRKHAQVPIVSHFTGIAVQSRMPNFGISSLVLTKLQRLAGADAIVFPGFGERMNASEEEVLANIRCCLEPWGQIRPTLPIPGGSDSAETLPLVFEKIGHTDFGFICGRGVFGHPEGPAAGAKSLHEAWAAIRPKG